MKTIMSFAVLAALSFSAFASENRQLVCDLTSEEQIILPAPSHRIIFVAKTAHVEIKEKKIAVRLEGKFSWNFELAVKSQSASKLSAKESERVYPSGNIARSYTKETSVKLTELETQAPKLVVKSEDKSLFRGSDLRYFGEYDCREL